MKSKSSKSSIVIMTEMIHPSHTNSLGTVFGGVIMSWIDIAGSISASRYSEKVVVTASVDDLHFIAPAYKGNIINIKARVNYVHNTSMEVGVRVESENPIQKEFNHIVSAYLTFVALDENKKPCSLPSMVLETQEEKEKYKEGEQRRIWRLERKRDISS